MIDFGELIRGQIPGKDGHVLPPDLTSGAYRLRDLADPAAGGLYEGKLIVDKTNGHAAYGCMICCGPEEPYMEFDPINLIIAAYENQVIQAPNSCGGGLQNVTGYFPTWWTDNSSIATANNAKITGVAVGSTTHRAQSRPMYWGFREYAQSCPLSQPEPSAGVNVCPSSASAAWTDPLSLSLLFPTLLTGIGDVSRVTVAPGASNWDGGIVTETVSQNSNNCPSGVSNACVGSSTFIIGAGYQPSVCTAWSGANCTAHTNVGPLLVATHNQFFDQHTMVSAQSVLSSGSCTQTCSQQYYCDQQQILGHTFTYSFQESTMSGRIVTLVTLE